jgi:hypothetical protein
MMRMTILKTLGRFKVMVKIFNFFTPINFKSTYAINWTKLLAPKSSSTPAPKSASTPDLRPAGKRPAASPTDSDANVNKKICGPSALKI